MSRTQEKGEKRTNRIPPRYTLVRFPHSVSLNAHKADHSGIVCSGVAGVLPLGLLPIWSYAQNSHFPYPELLPIP